MSHVKISLRCPGCDEVIAFPGSEAGTVQDCPECGGWVDVPELTRSPRGDDPYVNAQEQLWTEAHRQNAENDALIEKSKIAHEESRRQLEQSARFQDQAEASFHRFASLIERWEGLTDRFEKLLNKQDPDMR
jgi:hypothetical protein